MAGSMVLEKERLVSILENAVKSVITYLRSGQVSFEVVKEGSFGDVSKEFDVMAESIVVRNLIASGLRDFILVSEESGVTTYGSSPKWIIVLDPLDGSYNYEAGIPWSSVSIALAPYKADAKVADIEIALVAEVCRDRIYKYIKGMGCFDNDSPCRRLSKPSKIILGYFEDLRTYEVIPAYWSVKGKTKVRSLGSAALDLIYVGLSRVEGFVDIRARLRNVDVAAAIAIAESCGAKTYLCDGESATELRISDLTKVKCLIAGFNEDIARTLVSIVKNLNLAPS